jgi:2TM domain
MITVEQYERAEREMTLRESRRGWNIHAAIYAVVNTALVLVNVFAVPDFYWFPFPLVCWGIGLTAHYLFGVRWVERELQARQRKIEGLAEMRAKAA